ncbi:MAG: helix-turn-helix domain-containing protein [Bacteroidaceae bacterium]|nr:helix-turn-helix domain-containing protein [Bacteroidaceae bacterium]
MQNPKKWFSDVLSVSQLSQRLGFEYPQHFVRFFKALTGKTPTQWRVA